MNLTAFTLTCRYDFPFCTLLTIYYSYSIIGGSWIIVMYGCFFTGSSDFYDYIASGSGTYGYLTRS